MNIGIASIILIILVFVLAAFSVRSIKAANNEKKLADKTAASIQEYYAADTRAEAMIYRLDDMMISFQGSKWESKIKEMNQELKDTYGFDEIVVGKNEAGNKTYSFIVEVNETTKLQVEAEVTEENRCHITEWRTVSDEPEGNYTLDEDVELWDGNVNVEE